MSAKLSSRKKNILHTCIAIAYAFFLLFIVNKTGIVTINEAEKYISASKEVLAGNFISVLHYKTFYLAYIGFLSILLFFGNTTVVIIVQALLSFIAGNCVRKTLELLEASPLICYAGMLTFLFSFPIQVWTITLFSDSFFTSIATITLYYTIKRKSSKEISLWLLLIIILTFSRPPGIFLALPLLFYTFYTTHLISLKHIKIIFPFLFILLTIIIFYTPVETKGYIKPIMAGRIIVDSADYIVPGFINTEQSNLATAYDYLRKEKGIRKIVTLYIQKSISFFTLTRPYYSRMHNNIVTVYYFLYPLAILGLFLLWRTRRQPLTLLFLTCLFGLMHIVGLTYNEWHYRFTIPAIPLLIILASVCCDSIFNYSLRNKIISTEYE